MLKQTVFVRRRARKAAFFVPKKLAFHKLSRNRAAVYGDKAGLAAWAKLMNQPRDDLFARARFAPQKHGRLAACQFLDGVFKLHNRGRLPNKLACKQIRWRAGVGLGVGIGSGFERVFDQLAQARQLKRFIDKIKRAKL